MKGALVNFVAIIIGSGIGLMLKQGIPEKYKETMMHALGLAVLVIGLKMSLVTENILVMVVSLAVGAIIGEWLDIEKGLNALGDCLTKQLGKKYGNVGEGFVSATLIFCIGAMAIIGSIQEGLTGDASTIYAKSMIDGTAAVIFTAAMGIGVAFSAVPVLLYQGAITLGASFFGDVLSQGAIHELTAVGGVLIIAIGLSMLKIKTMRIANLLPAIPLAVVLVILEIF